MKKNSQKIKKPKKQKQPSPPTHNTAAINKKHYEREGSRHGYDRAAHQAHAGFGVQMGKRTERRHKVDPPSSLHTFVQKFLGVLISRSEHLSLLVVIHFVPCYEPT